MSEFCQLQLTCKDKAEADKIARALLNKKLVACVWFAPVESMYRWKRKIESGKEIALFMDSQINLFEQIEAEVTKLHSYDTFVLKMLPMNSVSEKARAWLEDALNA